MKRSTDRILVSHAGSLPAPDDFMELVNAENPDKAAIDKALPKAVAEVVRMQVERGVDVVNDGEMSKRTEGGGGFTYYAMARLGGLEERQFAAGESPASTRNITGRDAIEYPGFHRRRFGGPPPTGPLPAGAPRMRRIAPAIMCTGELTYVGRKQVDADVANLKAAIAGQNVEGYLPAVAPGTIEHWLFNEHYKSDEEFLFGIADAMHEEYKAITDAGLIVQIDDPDLPDGWQMFPNMSVAEYRKYAELRVEALNHGLRDCPRELIRLHVCWGSGHGPHVNDIALEHIVDIILKVRAECLSIEAANPRHDHEYRVWETTKLPDGMSLMPGVAGHCTDIVEHPRLVADRLERYATLVGKENVIAGTDCGLGTRVAHPEIAWGKLKAMRDGADLATKELWGR
ncbi:MAG: cobalamin-independent methionine synthase II family protein [Chloroflexi bacterium]|nr:cobalamin-independent methionine synthase II family protein [Chloroflexota bacterium]